MFIKKMCKWTFIVLLFIIIKKWKQVENSKKSESAIEQSESSTSGDENKN